MYIPNPLSNFIKTALLAWNCDFTANVGKKMNRRAYKFRFTREILTGG